jgi:hypothetical protein
MKFRIWDKETEFFWGEGEGIELFDCYANLTAIEKQRLIIQPYVGQKDKHDKEIYVGDIVEYRGGKRVVKFGEFANGEDVFAGAFYLSDPQIPRFGTARKSAFNQSKIVGNILQNDYLVLK